MPDEALKREGIAGVELRAVGELSRRCGPRRVDGGEMESAAVVQAPLVRGDEGRRG